MKSKYLFFAMFILVVNSVVFAVEKPKCAKALESIPEEIYNNLIRENIIVDDGSVSLNSEITLVVSLNQRGQGAIDVKLSNGEEYFFPKHLDIFRPIYRPLLLERGMSELSYLAAEKAQDFHYGRQLRRLEDEFGLKVIPPRISDSGELLDKGVSMSMGCYLVVGPLEKVIQALQAEDSSGRPLVLTFVGRQWNPPQMTFGAMPPQKTQN